MTAAIKVCTTSVKSVYVGTTKVKAVYVGSNLVHPCCGIYRDATVNNLGSVSSTAYGDPFSVYSIGQQLEISQTVGAYVATQLPYGSYQYFVALPGGTYHVLVDFDYMTTSPSVFANQLIIMVRTASCPSTYWNYWQASQFTFNSYGTYNHYSAVVTDIVVPSGGYGISPLLWRYAGLPFGGMRNLRVQIIAA